MKKLSLFVTVLLLTCTVNAQQFPCKKTLEESMQMVADVLNKPESVKLWGVKLNAPIIVIDPIQNKMYFTAIEDGKVQPVTEGEWNNKIPLANSIFEYNGKKQVTVVYVALMDDNAPCEAKINLLSHEIFHLHQKDLGIKSVVSTNSHMDEVQGRALLQIEMKALQQVLGGDLPNLSDALQIRNYRQTLYPGNNEELYELNEGLAEYTGTKIAFSNPQERIKSGLNYDINRGYTNAFGYFTGAAYAVILDQLYPEWKFDTDLLDKGMVFLLRKTNSKYFIENNDSNLAKLLDKYNYNQIIADETEALKSFGNIARFEELLKEESIKLCVINNGINFTYNPNDRVIALNDAVLLKNINIMGEWGQISVKSGIVRLNNWTAFYLLPPTEIKGNIVRGDDYEIQLNPDWKIIQNDKIYSIMKKD